jgi:hypothetical protein
MSKFRAIAAGRLNSKCTSKCTLAKNLGTMSTLLLSKKMKVGSSGRLLQLYKKKTKYGFRTQHGINTQCGLLFKTEAIFVVFWFKMVRKPPWPRAVGALAKQTLTFTVKPTRFGFPPGCSSQVHSHLTRQHGQNAAMRTL